MSRLKVGDKVITTNHSVSNYEKDWVGEIVEVDNSDIPYRIEFENGKLSWVYLYDVKLYNGNEQSLPKATLTQKSIKLLQTSLEDDLGITKVTIEFDTGLIITLNEKE